MSEQWLTAALAWDKGRPMAPVDMNDFSTSDAYGVSRSIIVGVSLYPLLKASTGIDLAEVSSSSMSRVDTEVASDGLAAKAYDKTLGVGSCTRPCSRPKT